MKKKLVLGLVFTLGVLGAKAQQISFNKVPEPVKSAFKKQYPEAIKISWEREKGNFEANWGGKSGEDNSAQFTPAGNFIEIVKAISIKDLPKNVAPYIASHYNGAKIKEAGKVTDSNGKTMYEAEIKGSDIIFDEQGNFLKKD
jgi:hypothetical protein